MRKHRFAIGAAVAAVLIARDAHGEIYHIQSPSTLETDGGSKLTLPPGYFLDEDTWQERDLEMQRLQELETRLQAENQSLRESSDDFPWMAVGAAGGLGVAIGALIMLVK